MAKREIELCRAEMAARGIDMMLIPTMDPHASEYVPEHFKTRVWISGFDGSAGTVLVTKENAGLWTDGRYFLHAEQQLAGSGIDLFKMGQPCVPELTDYIIGNLNGGKLAADVSTVSVSMGAELAAAGIEIEDVPELIDAIWQDRPVMPQGKAFALPLSLTGASCSEKLALLRGDLAACGADALVLTAPEDVAWLFNIRGSDITHVPVAVAYAIVTAGSAALYMDAAKAENIHGVLEECGAVLRPYEAVTVDIAALPANSTVIADESRLNYRLYRLIKSNARLVNAAPAALRRAIKNETELENMRRVHIKDGLMLTRFLFKLKENVKTRALTEYGVQEELDAARLSDPECTDVSFGTICGYGENGAFVHYKALPERIVPVKPEGLLLLDSGGQYLGGTTDVTRTVALGPVTDEQKRGFTLVAESMLALMNAIFPKGCAGYHLDAIARQPIWEQQMDFDHGTGHGVGYMLSVHEGPNGFRWLKTARSDRAPIEPGMIASDEPGIYVPGKYGVRIENLIVCKHVCTNEFGTFYGFEPLTFVPIDLDAIDPAVLTEKGIERLNRYHAMVYEKLAPHMTEEERIQLAAATRPVSK